MVLNKREMLAHLSAKTEGGAKKNFYKSTECGAWIEFEAWGVKIGSIVEGSEFGVEARSFNYPFSQTNFQKAVDGIEADAKVIWEWANTERGDGKTDAEAGLDWPLL